MIEEGRVWNVVSLHPAETPDLGTESLYYKDLKGRWCVGFPHEFVLKGDTIMNGQTYKKLIQTDKALFLCGLRQDGDRVFSCYGNEMQEHIIFDFGLKEGDIFTDAENKQCKMRVHQTDQIVVNGVERKRLLMWVYEDGAEIFDGLVDIWIEGIGCMNGPCFPFAWDATDSQSIVYSCYQGNMLLFSWDDYNTASVDQIERHPFTPWGFDLQGRKLSNGQLSNGQMRKGVYILNGRKIVVK